MGTLTWVHSHEYTHTSTRNAQSMSHFKCVVIGNYIHKHPEQFRFVDLFEHFILKKNILFIFQRHTLVQTENHFTDTNCRDIEEKQLSEVDFKSK